jgi:transmembrane sensor
MPSKPTRLPPEADHSREAIEATAAVWLSLRDRGLTAAETAEFVRWLQLDPRHAAIFDELDRTWKEFDRVGALQPAQPQRDQLDADLLAPRLRPSRPARKLWLAAGLAAAAVLAVLVAPRLLAPRHTAETAVGAFQKFDLPDGSVALLNTDTAIDTAFTAAERRVRIVRGEVFFTVAKDPARPFIVTAGPVAVRAVGTAFNVFRHNGTVEVLVTEGRVRLDGANQPRSLPAPAAAQPEAREIAAGERAVVAVPARKEEAPEPAVPAVQKVSATEMRRALAWQERRLEFDEVPLAEIVRQFNRHNRVQLVIGDPQLAQQRFSGVFRADGQESFLRLLQDDFGVQVTHRGREIVLRPAPGR